VGRGAGVLVCLALLAGPPVRAQDGASNWQNEARRYAEAQDWGGALKVIEGVLAKSPQDAEARTWRARILLWSGRAGQAEKEFRALAAEEPRDPDLLLGLASALGRQGRWQEARQELDGAVELDPKRADLHAARGRALQVLGEAADARDEFRKALALDPSSEEAKAGLVSVGPDPKHELRTGTDTDMFNFTGTYRVEWMSLMSRWTRHWGTSAAGNFYQRNGLNVGKFVGSVTARSKTWGALTGGGATGHDSGIIPKSEAFFNYDRGWRISEEGFVRGVEGVYEQHWYWYTTAQILTLKGSAIVYLPREWTWSLGMLGARSHFSGTPAEWRPSGMTRLGFPLRQWSERKLSGNVFFAAGTENFALVDQVGRFSAQTYGGGLKFQFTRRQDVTAYGAYQKRTQDRTQTSFGFSYGIHF
jgi:tetratricopeptide (TPR) repeat protein